VPLDDVGLDFLLDVHFPDFQPLTKALNGLETDMAKLGVNLETSLGRATQKAILGLHTLQLQLDRLRAENQTPALFEKELEIQKQITEEKHKQKMAEMEHASRPANLQQTVRQRIEVEKAERNLNQLKDSEYRKQQGLGGMLAKNVETPEKAVGTYKKLTGSGQIEAFGGMVGEAIGGPVGELIGEKVGAIVQGTLEAPAKLISGGFKLIGDALKGLQGELGPVGMGLDLAGKAMSGVVDIVNKVSPALGAMLGPLAELPGMFSGILGSLVSMGKVASPGQATMFELAVKDVQGVIGQTFLPLMEMMRDGIRLFGDTLANILPSSQEVWEALKELRGAFQELQDSLRNTLTEVGPVVRDVLIGALKTLAGVMAAVARATKDLVGWFGGFFKNIREWMGLGKGELRTSVGASAQPATLSGLSEYQNRLITNAFREPGTITKADLPNLMSNMNLTLREILAYITSLKWVGELSSKLTQAILIGMGIDPAKAKAAADNAAGAWDVGSSVAGATIFLPQKIFKELAKYGYNKYHGG
jgi:hypothetical protein